MSINLFFFRCLSDFFCQK